jgi:hypothetical protein
MGIAVAYPFPAQDAARSRHQNVTSKKMQQVYTSPSTVTISTSNILSIRPPRPPEARPQPAQGSETLCGSLAIVSPLDLIEWLCSNKKIWSLRLHGQGQGLSGEVVVVDGQMVDARWGDVRGMQALSEIVDLKKGSFDLAPVSGSIERTLQGPWQSLLLNAVQMLDERNFQRRSGTPSEGTPEVRRSSSHSGEHMMIALPADAAETTGERSVPDAVSSASRDAGTSAEALIDRGFAALRAGNSFEAKRCWTEALALDPDNRSVQFNLRKLDSAP